METSYISHLYPFPDKWKVVSAVNKTNISHVSLCPADRRGEVGTLNFAFIF